MREKYGEGCGRGDDGEDDDEKGSDVEVVLKQLLHKGMKQIYQ